MLWLENLQFRTGTARARRKIIEGIGVNPYPRAVGLLARAVRDSDPEVRRLAALVLGRLEDERRIRPLLKAAMDVDPEVQKTAISALKRVPNGLVADVLAPLLRHPDVGVRACAGQVLAAQGWHAPDLEEEAWLLVARHQFVRAGELGSAAVPALASVLGTSFHSLSVGALDALGRISDPRVVPLLIGALDSPDASVCLAAMRALAKAGNEAVEPLTAMLRHSNGHVRAAAVEALSGFGPEEMLDRILPMLNDPLWEVRRAAADVLGRTGKGRVVEPLAARLTDEDTDVRESVVMALGNLGARSVIGPLVLALGDPASGVRRLAAAALARIDEHWAASAEARNAATRLASPAAKLSPDARYFVEQMLGPLAVKESPPTTPRMQNEGERPAPSPAQRRRLAVNLFLPILTDLDRDLRLATAEALGLLGDNHAVAALIRALGDSDAAVRATVEQSLRRLEAPNPGT